MVKAHPPLRLKVIDSHTAGEPTRCVLSGGPHLGAGPLAERLERLRREHDLYRRAILCEPRGSDVLVGAFLLEPVDPACVAGVIFFNNAGYLGMCGGLSTTEAVELAKAAHAVGCSGLMILPPYVYKGDWRENKAHVAAILEATPLPGLLYNNPVAYGTDFLPEQIQELAREFANLAAVKESSTDVRRVTAIRSLIGDRLSLFVGVDDAIVEGIAAEAVGWVAGLVNALPRESVDLFNLAHDGKAKEAFELYRWFLPLLRMDTVPKFIQLIKQVQQEAGIGSARVRVPRLELVGAELAATCTAFEFAQTHRPSVAVASTPFTL